MVCQHQSSEGLEKGQLLLARLGQWPVPASAQPVPTAPSRNTSIGLVVRKTQRPPPATLLTWLSSDPCRMAVPLQAPARQVHTLQGLTTTWYACMCTDRSHLSQPVGALEALVVGHDVLTGVQPL